MRPDPVRADADARRSSGAFSCMERHIDWDASGLVSAGDPLKKSPPLLQSRRMLGALPWPWYVAWYMEQMYPAFRE